MTEKAEYLQSPVFVSHGYVEYTGTKQRGERYTRYRSYLVSENLDLWNAKAFAYERGFASGAIKDTFSLGSGSDRRKETRVQTC